MTDRYTKNGFTKLLRGYYKLF